MKHIFKDSIWLIPCENLRSIDKIFLILFKLLGCFYWVIWTNFYQKIFFLRSKMALIRPFFQGGGHKSWKMALFSGFSSLNKSDISLYSILVYYTKKFPFFMQISKNQTEFEKNQKQGVQLFFCVFNVWPLSQKL